MIDRSQYLGSSDADSIMGDDWSELYARKIGEIGEPNLSRAFPVQLGRSTEDFHIFWTTRALNGDPAPGEPGEWDVSKFVKSDDPRERVQHYAALTLDDGTPLGSHPDALLRHRPTGRITGLEVKITGRWGNAREAAHYYMPQIQHHLLVWGWPEILFSVIVGTTEPERIWIGAEPEYQAIYAERCQRFWTHVRERRRIGPPMWERDPAGPIPAAVKDKIPFNGTKRRSLEGHNEATDLIARFIRASIAKEAEATCREALKAMFAPDEAELYHPALTMKRNRAGAVVFKIVDAAAVLVPEHDDQPLLMG